VLASLRSSPRSSVGSKTGAPTGFSTVPRFQGKLVLVEMGFSGGSIAADGRNFGSLCSELPPTAPKPLSPVRLFSVLKRNPRWCRRPTAVRSLKYRHLEMHRCASKLTGLLCGTSYGLCVVLRGPWKDSGGPVWYWVATRDVIGSIQSRCNVAPGLRSSTRLAATVFRYAFGTIRSGSHLAAADRYQLARSEPMPA